MADIDFQPAADPERSAGQQIQHVTGTLGLLARRLGVELVTGDAFVTPVNVDTGEVVAEDDAFGGYVTGAPMSSRFRDWSGPTQSRAELEKKWPAMRNRVG